MFKHQKSIPLFAQMLFFPAIFLHCTILVLMRTWGHGTKKYAGGPSLWLEVSRSEVPKCLVFHLLQCLMRNGNSQDTPSLLQAREPLSHSQSLCGEMHQLKACSFWQEETNNKIKRQPNLILHSYNKSCYLCFSFCPLLDLALICSPCLCLSSFSMPDPAFSASRLCPPVHTFAANVVFSEPPLWFSWW